MQNPVEGPHQGHQYTGMKIKGPAKVQNGNIHNQTYVTSQPEFRSPGSEHEPKNNADIILASKHGQLSRLQALLSLRNKDIDHMDKNGRGALHHAVANNRRAVVELLLERGADPGLQRGRTRHGVSPLLLAAQAGRTDLAKLLLEENAPVGAVVKYGQRDKVNALVVAIREQHLDMVQLLINHRADVNFVHDGDLLPGRFGPLSIAILFSTSEIVELLINNGAKGRTVMLDTSDHASQSEGHLALVHSREKLDDFQISTLELAVLNWRSGSRRILKLVADYCRDVPDDHGSLMAQARRREPQNGGAQKALHLAVATGNLEAMGILLEAGASADGVFQDLTPLYIAATAGHISMVRWLLERGGADPSSTSSSARERHWSGRKVIQYRVTCGGQHLDLEIPVLEYGDNESRRLNSPSNHDSALGAAVRTPEIVQRLLDAGASVKSRNNWGRTAIFEAAGLLQLKSVKIMLDNGASKSARDTRGRTPYDVAKATEAAHGDERRDKFEILNLLRSEHFVPSDDLTSSSDSQGYATDESYAVRSIASAFNSQTSSQSQPRSFQPVLTTSICGPARCGSQSDNMDFDPDSQPDWQQSQQSQPRSQFGIGCMGSQSDGMDFDSDSQRSKMSYSYNSFGCHSQSISQEA